MRRLSLPRRLLALVVVLCMLPGLPSLLETVEHLLHDGHLPHSELHEQLADGEHAHDGDEEHEHGCTTLSHRCGCHSSMPCVLSDDDDLDHELANGAEHALSAARLHALSNRSTAPPTRPPIG